jgi:glycyl-tRNA synthetase beta chain
MGGYYAAAEGQDPQVAAAIRDHYRPQGPSEEAPSAPTTVAVAIADKLDMILAFFSIGQAPTGSRDPFALRRAALGIIRILLDNGLAVPLGKVMSSSPFPGEGVLDFFADRLKGLLRERGARHDLVDAVFALGDDDLVRVTRRIDALDAFLATDDGTNLLAAYKRAGNILDAEAKNGALPQGPARLAGPDEEMALYRSNIAIRSDVSGALEREDFGAAMAALASQRAPVDAFFNNVFVNSPEPSERDNRLRLLAEVRTNMALVADFSRISG